MTPEERKILDETYELAKKNHALLTSLHRSNRVSMIVKALYWVIIIALSFGALFAIKPYLSFLKGIGGNSGSASPDSYSQQLQDLLK